MQTLLLIYLTKTYKRKKVLVEVSKVPSLFFTVSRKLASVAMLMRSIRIADGLNRYIDLEGKAGLHCPITHLTSRGVLVAVALITFDEVDFFEDLLIVFLFLLAVIETDFIE